MPSSPINEIRKHRKQVGYEQNIPRCETCIHIGSRSKARKSGLPIVMGKNLCTLHFFPVNNCSICNHWQDKQGFTI